MAPHSNTLAWKILWMDEPGRLRSMGSLRVRHDWATSLSHIGEGNGNPLQYSCLENPRDEGAWWAAVSGVAQSWTRLKRLSSSSNSSVTQLCPTLCNSMDCSTPGFPVHHQLLELAETHIHQVGNAIQPSHSLLSLSPPAFNLYQHQDLFQS